MDRPEQAALQVRLEARMRDLMARTGDKFLPKEAYYARFGLDVDQRGKVKGIVENPYDRDG